MLPSGWCTSNVKLSGNSSLECRKASVRHRMSLELRLRRVSTSDLCEELREIVMSSAL
jgi:hypothetical protein